MMTMNNIFERAFSHITSKETVDELLECIGEELSCDRVSVFELHEDGYYDNTYEWCTEGVLSEHDFLQHLPFSGMSSWRQSIETGDILAIGDLEDVWETEPELYALFHVQQIRSMIVSGLKFHGRTNGFVILENPPAEIIEEADTVLPVIRYILSALLYAERLIHRLERAGYADSLTGAGNRLSLQDHLETINREEPLGLVYCDAVNWLADDGKPEHLDHDQMVIHTGAILQTVFDEDFVFRVGSGEFIALCPELPEEEFEHEVRRLKTLFLEQDLAIATGTAWEARCETSYDSLIRRAHLIMYENKRDLNVQSGRITGHAAEEERIEELAKNADIRMYRENEFFVKADEWLAEIYDEDVLTTLVDINYFRLYNDIFGRIAGNVFLEYLAEVVANLAKEYQGIAGYLGGDNFILMIPVLRDTTDSQIYERIEEHLFKLDYADGFAPVLGIYLSENRQETAIHLYDRALFALSEIRGSYSERYCLYSADHFEHEKSDKMLLLDMKKGLENGEFSFVVQPQVNLRTGSIIGAEALIRWNRSGQTVSTQHFVNVMEKSGYIFDLDRFVWEEVCRWQRSLLDRGVNVLPCSVNVSRMDFFFTDVAEEFRTLVERYQIDPSLISIEITESAFTDNLEKIQTAIQELHEAGFRICMDDFGSGASSLSMLHKMNVDVLKTDVNFMNRIDPDNRAVCIVESVINMAHLIGILVITEGIETEKQVEELASLGDHYAQGFYFYEPMTTDEYEKLLEHPESVGQQPYKGGPIMTSRIKFRDMLSEGLLNDTLLDNIIGPAAVFRREGDTLTIVQMNESYYRLTGINPENPEDMSHYMQHYRNGTYTSILEAFKGADRHPLDGSPAHGVFVRDDGSQIEMKSRIFPLYTLKDNKLYLSVMQE